LMVVQVIHELSSSTGFRFGVSEIFENPTVEKLAAIAEKKQHGDRGGPAVVRLAEGGTDAPIYFIYAGPAELALARSIGGDRPAFGIEMPWPLEWREAVTNNQTARFPGLAEIVGRFVDELLRHLGAGKCVLAGYSFAGLLAFEVARRLLAKGKEIDAVIIIDKYVPYPSAFAVVSNNLVDCWTGDWTGDSRRSFKRNLARSCLIIWWAIEFLGKRAASDLWLRPDQLTSFLDEKGAPLRWYLVERLYIEIERNLGLEPIDCRGIILRPEYLDRYGAVMPPDEYLGWKTLFKRGSESFAVSGNHFSMVREHSRELAQLIGKAIKRAVDQDQIP
jgi:thioesterase domain-containing protein